MGVTSYIKQKAGLTCVVRKGMVVLEVNGGEDRGGSGSWDTDRRCMERVQEYAGGFDWVYVGQD